jgi:hypothetical protein
VVAVDDCFRRHRIYKSYVTFGGKTNFELVRGNEGGELRLYCAAGIRPRHYVTRIAAITEAPLESMFELFAMEMELLWRGIVRSWLFGGFCEDAL